MLNNTIGLEAEMFLFDKNGSIVRRPDKEGFPTDTYYPLVEIRGLPGSSAEEAYLNFLQEYNCVLLKAKEKGYTVSLDKNIVQIDTKVHNEIIRAIGEKEVPESKNIYKDIDILAMSDNVVDMNKRSRTFAQILNVKKSAGLHIHFSSTDNAKTIYYNYTPTKIEAEVSGITISRTLYDRGMERTREISVSRITNPVINFIVKGCDDSLFSKYNRETTKYRRKGFYEKKPYGFEYRSLPFSDEVFANLYEITHVAFSLLNSI